MIDTKKSKNAVTLMELLITIGLASVLLALSLATFGRATDQQSVNNSCQQAAFAIKNARLYARTKGIVTNISFPTGGSNYSIEADDTIITNNQKSDAMSGILPEDTKILSNSCPNLYFYVDGSPVDSNNDSILNDCVITIGYNTNLQKSITVKSGSGSVIYD